MPTASSAASASTSIQPTAPQYGPRGTGSRSAIARSALDFGAPVTEAGGVMAAHSRPQPTSGAQPAADPGHQVDQAGVVLDREQVR